MITTASQCDNLSDSSDIAKTQGMNFIKHWFTYRNTARSPQGFYCTGTSMWLTDSNAT